MQMRRGFGLLGWSLAGVMAIGAAGTAYAATSSPAQLAAATTGAPAASASATPSHAKHAKHHHHPRPAKRNAFPGIEGAYTVHRKAGYTQVDYARGTVSSLNGSTLVVKSANGATTTFQLASATKYGVRGHKEVMTDLHAGEKVFAVGTGATGAITATHVTVPPTWPAS